ncbi:hypothetical protein Maeo_0031 [Methanococcus aeolicus Nankai-3]|jgi:hypothetical protein|uniref:EVE domain-containing protein n=1 Tax=Methanococcus aeolicus (strain ATCC BAA-1280 / DSM 17508 / OCM 812 / Nankai-3) TaxID=419665 RepID=A6UT02_META3|nr:EVE domain-containing protein [Methanococcus aeolicus]ABR55624.1 hypothetical protein Maeo_0031 [Methanococcus aeolicus Nankai-3]
MDTIMNTNEKNKKKSDKKSKKDTLKIIVDDPIQFTEDAVIVCMTKEHDKNDIYSRLIGVPLKAEKIAREYIDKGTRLFIYYKGIGIRKIVVAIDKPYIDNTVIEEWNDGLPETYPVRVETKLLGVSHNTLSLKNLQDLEIKRVDTGKIIVSYHLRNSLTPISDIDADAIQKELGL